MKTADRVLKWLNEEYTEEKKKYVDVVKKYDIKLYPLYVYAMIDDCIEAGISVEQLDAIFKKCSFGISKFWKQGVPLYRGITTAKAYTLKTVRTDRKPMNTDETLHNMFSKAFKERFGFSGRGDCVFISTAPGVAENYGSVYVVFPEGRFEWIYSNTVRDLYMQTKQLLDNQLLVKGTDIQMSTHHLVKKMETDDNLRKDVEKAVQGIVATYTKNKVNPGDFKVRPPEIMVHCKQYHAFMVEPEGSF